MNTLQLKFVVNLKNTELHKETNGVSFYKWFPISEQKALVLKDTLDFNFKIWFEMFGFFDAERNAVKYDSDRKDIDPNIVSTQWKLDSGPIFGKITFKDLDQNAYSIFKTFAENSAYTEYEIFGKQVIQEIFYPNLSNFIDILKFSYCQYWLNELPIWDSRENTLRDYCRLFNLTWSLDNQNWYEFSPTLTISAKFPLSWGYETTYMEYVTKEDWYQLTKLIDEGFKPKLSHKILSEAHMLWDKDEFKQSYLIGISALELSIEEFVKSREIKEDIIATNIQKFKELRVKPKFSIIATILNFSENEIRNCIEAIDIRNKIVHDGIFDPEKNHQKILRQFFRIVSKFISKTYGSPAKFPSIDLEPYSDPKKEN